MAAARRIEGEHFRSGKGSGIGNGRQKKIEKAKCKEQQHKMPRNTQIHKHCVCVCHKRMCVGKWIIAGWVRAFGDNRTEHGTVDEVKRRCVGTTWDRMSTHIAINKSCGRRSGEHANQMNAEER